VSHISSLYDRVVADSISFDSSCTFWRFMIQVPLGPCEMKVMYNVNGGPVTEFWVPALDQNMRWAAYSVGPVYVLDAHVRVAQHFRPGGLV
jgi:hypothetical protein